MASTIITLEIKRSPVAAIDKTMDFIDGGADHCK